MDTEALLAATLQQCPGVSGDWHAHHAVNCGPGGVEAGGELLEEHSIVLLHAAEQHALRAAVRCLVSQLPGTADDRFVQGGVDEDRRIAEAPE